MEKMTSDLCRGQGWLRGKGGPGDGAAAHLESMLLEEAQGMGEHLQGRHFLSIYRLQLGLQGEILAGTQGHSAEGRSSAPIS